MRYPCTMQNPVDPSPDYPSGADVTYICLDPTCGWHGTDAPEDSDGIVYCPDCGDKLTYAAQCRDCGEWFPSDQVKDGRCPECYVEWKAEESNIHPVFQGTLNALRNGPGFFGGGK